MAASNLAAFRRFAPTPPAGKALHVLLVEGSAGDPQPLRRLMAQCAPGIESTSVRSLSEALAHARGAKCDAMLLDVPLPDAASLDMVTTLCLAFPALPLILVTGHDDEDLALQAMRCGAQDCVVRGRSDASMIGRAIRHAVARKAYAAVLTERANFDPLTGLANRALMRDRLDHALARASRARRRAAVMFIDLDGFKAINDALGHDGGDEVLKAFAGLLSRTARKAETVARFGGDEFVVVLEEIGEIVEATAVASRILQALEAPLALPGTMASVSCSIGIAVYPDDGGDAATLLHQADTAMFAAKKCGPNNVRTVRAQR